MHQSQAAESLDRLLQPTAGGWTGEETEEDLGDDIRVYRDGMGSHRFVLFRHGQPAAAIQVMGFLQEGLVSNIYTRPVFRRQGCFRRLVEKASQVFTSLTFSTDRTVLGDLAVAGLKAYAQDQSSSR